MEPPSSPEVQPAARITGLRLGVALRVYNPELISVDGLTFRDDKDDNDRFLRQVRQSKGYDVDCFPDEEWNSPYGPLFLDCGYKPHDVLAENTARFAMAKINEHSKKNYSLVDVLKAVSSRIYTVFLTFIAWEHDGAKYENVGDDEMVEVLTFRAMVAWGPNPEKMELMEYKILYMDGSWRELHVLNGSRVLPSGDYSV